MTNKRPLNKRVVDAIEPPARGRDYYWDSKQPGLSLCVTSTGTKTWYVIRKIDGRKVFYRLGKASELSTEKARSMAGERVVDLLNGVDLQSRKRAARSEMTFGELFDYWMAYSKEHKRTWKEDQRKYKKFLTGWNKRRLSTIGVLDVERLHSTVKTKSGPYQANRVLEMVKAMFNRVIKKRVWTGENPAANVTKYSEQSRERFILPHEMKAFFASLSEAPEVQQHFFLLLLLTGQRRSAVQAMRWADLDLQSAIWTIPASDSKNKQSITIPLVEAALSILLERSTSPAKSPYVFPSRSKRGHITEPKRGWQQIIERAGLHGLRMHDLRRTLGSWQASAGVSTTIIGKGLGHAHGSRATNVYARLELEPVRAAVTQATAAMLEAGKGSIITISTTEAGGDGEA